MKHQLPRPEMKEGRNLLHSHADGNQEVSRPQKIDPPQRDLPRWSLVSVPRAQG